MSNDNNIIFFDKALTLLSDETQYITWGLVLFGWIIAAIVAAWQIRRNNINNHQDARNEWIGEFREKLESVEDYSLKFWVEDSSIDKTLAIAKLTRDIKSLTTLAKEIEKADGGEYQPKLFKDLRQAITFDAEINNRPLSTNCMQVRKIREACVSLRSAYPRKIINNIGKL